MKVGFYPNMSRTSNSDSEELSLRCLEGILCDHSKELKAYLTKNDKTPNYDGYIELLDKYRVCGKVTVQVKTLHRKFYETPKFDCPTSLLGYAEGCPTELVFLIVVNRERKTAYWKYISRKLIADNASKIKQKSVRIDFSKDEQVNKENVNDVARKWKELYSQLSKLVETEDKESNISAGLLQSNVVPLNIESKSVVKIQSFIDEFNYLLDTDYNVIKRIYFPNVWKIGIAFSVFSSDEVAMALYGVREGQNDLLIKQLNSGGLRDYASSAYALHSSDNKILKKPKSFALELISDYVIKLFSGGTLFITDETSIEYIFDFIDKEGNFLGLEKQKYSYNLLYLKEEIERKYLLEENILTSVVKGGRSVRVDLLYDSVAFLTRKQYKNIKRLYPSRREYEEREVSVNITLELAYEKVVFLYSRIQNLFETIIISNFPALYGQISLHEDYDLLIVNLSNNGLSSDYHNLYVRLYYFKSNRPSWKQIITSLNFRAKIFENNNIDSETSLTDLCFGNNVPLSYNEYSYELRACENEVRGAFNDNFYVISVLCGLLKERFISYFKKTEE